MLPLYVQYYQTGTYNPTPDWKTISETPNTAIIAADRAHGIIIGHYAMTSAINKARKHDIGIVNIVNSGHMGAIGYFPMMAAKENMIGICAIAAGNGILPTFAAEPRLGTNPIAFAAPSGREAPFLFDAATSA
ncbi:MAG TPA: Ldh family oxidoreductase, partial [Candidatus Marinimicrobia bacterium]|nr:Ldh family oxidoreductase [Candidatus Neomarinimicrobiota bacterium]